MVSPVIRSGSAGASPSRFGAKSATIVDHPNRRSTIPKDHTMPVTLVRCWVLISLLASLSLAASAAESPLSVWPDLAPGETSRETGTDLPRNPKEDPPITRVVNVRRPTIDVFLPEQPNGTAILVLPGGGFGKIVPDMEGSEAAPDLNKLGIAVFVLRYRTNEAITPGEPPWKRPLQDAQRSLRLIRSRADEWRIDPQRVGVLGFSAGGQVASILHTEDEPAYESLDAIDQESCRPDFSLLIYTWRV